MMPVAIVASTLASATSLRQTASGNSAVAEVQLLPLSYRDMKSILVDVCKRAGQPWGSGDEPDAPVKQLLKFTYGIPRFLAWAIHCMSGDPMNVSEQRLKLGAHGQEPCPWLRMLKLPLKGILGRLVIATAMYRTADWLVDDTKSELMAQILAHAVLERKVVRSASITPAVRWQDVENAGLCSLLHAGTCIPTSSPAGSPYSSAGGDPSQASGSNQPQGLSDVQALLDSAMEQRTAASDVSSGYAVFVCPLLVIAAMKGLRVNQMQLSVLPLVQHLADQWRIREYTDLTVFIFRLELARAVLGLKQMSLYELLPSGAELPAEFQHLQILVPKAHPGELYKRAGPFPTTPEFLQHCESCSPGSSYAYIGGGSDQGPDSWLVLQAVDGERFVVFVQSKKRQGKVGLVTPQRLDEEARKCWGADSQLKRLLVYVTDERTTTVGKLYEAKEVGLSVVVVGRSQQDSFYSYAVALTKRCIECDEQNEKQPGSSQAAQEGKIAGTP